MRRDCRCVSGTTALLETFPAAFMSTGRIFALDPSPWNTPPTARQVLYETAVQRKSENIPPALGGALMRAIITGGRYPRRFSPPWLHGCGPMERSPVGARRFARHVLPAIIAWALKRRMFP